MKAQTPTIESLPDTPGGQGVLCLRGPLTVDNVSQFKSAVQREEAPKIIFDLTDTNGSQVGSVSSFIEKVPAAQTKPFQTPLKQPAAAFGLVREIISHPPRA